MGKTFFGLLLLTLASCATTHVEKNTVALSPSSVFDVKILGNEGAYICGVRVKANNSSVGYLEKLVLRDDPSMVLSSVSRVTRGVGHRPKTYDQFVKLSDVQFYMNNDAFDGEFQITVCGMNGGNARVNIDGNYKDHANLTSVKTNRQGKTTFVFTENNDGVRKTGPYTGTITIISR